MILKCVLKCITNNCKPPQNFEFQKTELSFRFFRLKSFHEFVTLVFWENGTYCLSSVLFGHENGSSEYFCKKTYQAWPKAVKTFKKHQNAPIRTYKKNQILLYRESFRWIHIVLYLLPVSPLFLKGENEISKKLGKRSNF